MAEIRVNSAMLRDTAQTISGELSNFQNLTSEIQQGLSSLSNTWEGDAFTNFVEKVNSLTPTFERYSEVINSYVTFLNKSAEEYDTTESEAQSATEALENNLFK